LERLVGQIAQRVFSGRVHPSEIVARIAREADLARFQHESGPASANVYRIVLHPEAVTGDVNTLEEQLASAIEDHAASEGLRLEGPVSVSVTTSESVPVSGVKCLVEVAPGEPVVWARLVAVDRAFEIGRNRVIVGRDEDADVVISEGDVSRRHALIWRQGGRYWIRDLGSSNGTTVNGQPVGGKQQQIEEGSVLAFAAHRFRFLIA
jgi:hypothetical protein